MREIKFRAWEKEFGSYGRVDTIDFDKRGVIHHIVTQEHEYWHASVAMDIGIITIEQYTGLKDVNGKPIYEGDIVKSSYRYAQPKVSEVIIENGNTYISGEDVATGGDMLLCDFVDKVEVIGNVHQDQKLLEVPHE